MYTNYQDQRTQGVRISDSWRYRGLKTVILENKFIIREFPSIYS